MRVSPRWRTTASRGRLLTVALVAVVIGYAVGRPELAVLAAPLLVLAVASRRRPASVEVTTSVETTRCFEDDVLEVTVELRATDRVDELSVELPLDPTIAVEPAGVQIVTGVAAATFRWEATPTRWGRYQLGPAHASVVAGGRAVTTGLRGSAAELIVYPRPTHAGAVPLPPVLPRRAGDHAARVPGTGMEFVGTRPYVPGDRIRHINWPATTKRGQLYVNELADERSADLVAVIDALSDVGDPPNSTLDKAVRGAAGLTQAYLRHGDRAGVVALGGILRWLAPGMGQRQLYQVIDAILDVRVDHSFVDPDLDRVPRTALPPGALVVLFSPLLDSRAVEAARDLRARGYPLVVVDVLADGPEPAGAPVGDLAVRLWRLDRQVTRASLVETGAVLVDAAGGSSLDEVLAPLRRMVIPGAMR